jgi:peptidoglycan-N-acetylglucosamine deacetylase
MLEFQAMRRRIFLKTLFQAGALFSGARALADQPNKFKRPQIALTMDDPATELGSYIPWREANRRILDTLHRRRLKIALFVCGMRVDSVDGRELLQEWNDAGHLLCNHSYSHLNFNGPRTTYDRFAADFLRDEPVLSPFSNRTKMFRFPSLKEGDTAEKRDDFREFLDQRGYRVGHVTVDGSDWYVDQRMMDKLRQSPGMAKEPYRDYLIAHLLDRAAFYRQLAIDVLGYEIPHTLLVHYRTLNALFLSDVMTAFERQGWEWIDAKRAFDSPIFLRKPQTLPAGESLVWALAAEDGRFKDRLRYPGESDDYEKQKMDELGL